MSVRYLRTPRAAVALDGPAAPAYAPPQDTAAPCRSGIRWATRAFQGRLGHYVAVKLVHHALQVGIRRPTGQLDWVPVELAMTSRDADDWSRTGFQGRSS